MLKKNEIITLEITGMTNEGNGVGRYDGIAVFVPMTAVGDVIECRVVKVHKSFCYGIIHKLITASENRIDDNCEAYAKCGGCSFRHFSYDEELRIKEDFVRSSFERIGKINALCESILGSEKTEHYRNKAQYPVAEQDGKAVCGFYSRRSHRVTGTYDCLLQPTVFTDIVMEIMNYINKNNIPAYNEFTGQGLVRHIYLRRGEHTGEIMVCIVVTDIEKTALFDNLATKLSHSFSDIKSVILNENSKNTNVIMGKKYRTIFGKDTITDIMCGRTIILSPQSFYQVNTLQAERLYAIAEDYADLKENEILLDLYCGTGTIGLSMCDEVKKLIGVEVIPSAIENAKLNAQENGVENAEFICGDAGQISEILYDRGERPDVIIADPARKGCDKPTLEYMARMNPRRIVMISCNPATAARDCAILQELGYCVEKYRAVDLFPRTTHVETVCLMSRAKDLPLKKQPSNNVILKIATQDDMQTIWEMQVRAFSDLLEKYQDYEMSPAAESFEKVMARYRQPWTTYYFIVAEDEVVGAIRVVDKKDGSRKRISPIWIMKEHRNKGYAQSAITAAEQIYGSENWCLDTILQEKGNLHLYEKMGYHQTGQIEKINDRMDIIFYEKD